MFLRRHFIFSVLFGALLSLFTVAPLFGASPKAFRHLGLSQGLSQSSVLSITQDRLGNLWFGTQDGLNVYDGYAFKVYKPDFQDESSLPSGFVGALFTDSDGTVWVGTASGLSRFDARNSCFENFGDAAHGNINHIGSWEDALALSTDHGLLLFNNASQSFRHVSLGPDVVVRMTYAADGFLLVATDAGLFILQGDKVNPVSSFAGHDVHAVAPAQDGGWWVGTYGSGLYRTDANFRVVRHFTAPRTLHSDYVRVLHTDNYGRLWVGTYEGLAVYDDLDGSFTVCRHDSNPYSLRHNSVRAIYSDAQNGIWIGTWFGGVNYWSRQDDKIREISFSLEGAYGFVSCLCPSPSSRDIWVGTNDDGLFLCSSNGEGVRHPKIPLVSGNVKCIVPGRDGYLYVGMHMGGIMRLDPHSFRLQGFAINEHTSIKNGCYSLLEIENGKWLVGSLEGLYFFDVRKGSISVHPAVEVEPELGKRLITVLFQDRSGRIWVGTDEGFYRFSPAESNVQKQSVLLPTVKAAGFHVNQILQDSDGRIWIASSRGLVEFSGVSEPRLFTVADGLPDDNVRSILSSEGSLWICSGRQICRLQPENGMVNVINRPTDNEFVDGAACVGADGFFYFGGLGGLTCFDPNDMYANPYSPLPWFSGVSLDGRSSGTLERSSDGACVTLRVSSDKGPVVVHWSVFNPLSYGGDSFYYRLDGLDDIWHRTNDRQATFTNLAPGKYNLQLRSANNEGKLCDGMVSMEIRVLPKWWQSRIFRVFLIMVSVLFLVLVALLLASLLRSKVQIHTRNAEIRRLEESLDKTRDLLSGQVRSVLKGEASADGEFLHRAASVVEANIDNDAFSSEEFARQMYMSRSKLYARIQETTGGTVADFIRKIRFEKACALLLEGRYSVSEISSMVGFASPSYFATCFKKYTGVLPKNYGKSGVH